MSLRPFLTLAEKLASLDLDYRSSAADPLPIAGVSRCPEMQYVLSGRLCYIEDRQQERLPGHMLRLDQLLALRTNRYDVRFLGPCKSDPYEVTVHSVSSPAEQRLVTISLAVVLMELLAQAPAERSQGRVWVFFSENSRQTPFLFPRSMPRAL